jgi:hypothetical protein
MKVPEEEEEEGRGGRGEVSTRLAVAIRLMEGEEFWECKVICPGGAMRRASRG